MKGKTKRYRKGFFFFLIFLFAQTKAAKKILYWDETQKHNFMPNEYQNCCAPPHLHEHNLNYATPSTSAHVCLFRDMKVPK